MPDLSTPILRTEDDSYTAEDIRSVFVASGIAPGDTMMVHSRLFTLGRLNTEIGKDAVLDAFIDALKAAVGPEGTIIFPAFSLSVCRTGVFDVNETKSEMGILSERARVRPDSRRSIHPLYSVAIIGNGAERLLHSSGETSFGPGSLFDLLHTISAGTERETVKFMTIGMSVPTEGITYVHYIEELCDVPYRYHKTFTGSLVEETDGVETPYTVDFFVRDLSTEVVFDQDALWERLNGACQVNQQRLGNSSVAVLPERCVFEATRSAIELQSDFLCKGGYHPS
ncbi:MAG: AAC(3) family N-acetyltransferase [Spirochaeta sp.]|jgi:aminoglycoside 3-N-acetyltransferase|nr:AAC(3) family N-acetyltransferase [Spirochaeta sp.]